jgi:hypothetical protein
MCCVSRVRPSASPSNLHSNDKTARSSAISSVYALVGLTRRMCQCRGSCPGIRVVPLDPIVNGPSNWNVAGGSSQFATFVI